MPYSYDLYGQFLYEKILERTLLLPSHVVGTRGKLWEAKSDQEEKIQNFLTHEYKQAELERQINGIDRVVLENDVEEVVSGRECRLVEAGGSDETRSASLGSRSEEKFSIYSAAAGSFDEFLEAVTGGGGSTGTRALRPYFSCGEHHDDDHNADHPQKTPTPPPRRPFLELDIGQELAPAIHSYCLIRALTLMEPAGMALWLFAYVTMRDKKFTHYYTWRDEVCLPDLMRQSERRKAKAVAGKAKALPGKEKMKVKEEAVVVDEEGEQEFHDEGDDMHQSRHRKLEETSDVQVDEVQGILTSPGTLHLGSAAGLLNQLQWLVVFQQQVLGNAWFRRD
eukprot:g11298.t1